jgi:hypothetical protein
LRSERTATAGGGGTLAAARHVATLTLVLLVAPVPCMLAHRLQYTLSLLIFLLPSALILYWFWASPEEELRPVRRAFWVTLAILVPMGVILNLFWADDFFVYPNHEAVLWRGIPALDLTGFDWEHPIPLEEFAFYLSGFLSMLLLYVWGDESFFSRYNEPYGQADYRTAAAKAGTLLRFSVVPVVIATLVLGFGWAYKVFRGEGGFPGYLAYLMFIPFVVTVTLSRVAMPCINWQAFSFMFLLILVDSVVWEVTLAIPGGWWGYRSEAMTGIYIAPWEDLPIEAVLVWVLATIATVTLFEALKLFFHHPQTNPWHRLREPQR